MFSLNPQMYMPKQPSQKDKMHNEILQRLRQPVQYGSPQNEKRTYQSQPHYPLSVSAHVASEEISRQQQYQLRSFQENILQQSRLPPDHVNFLNSHNYPTITSQTDPLAAQKQFLVNSVVMCSQQPPIQKVSSNLNKIYEPEPGLTFVKPEPVLLSTAPSQDYAKQDAPKFVQKQTELRHSLDDRIRELVKQEIAAQSRENPEDSPESEQSLATLQVDELHSQIAALQRGLQQIQSDTKAAVGAEALKIFWDQRESALLETVREVVSEEVKKANAEAAKGKSKVVEVQNQREIVVESITEQAAFGSVVADLQKQLQSVIARQAESDRLLLEQSQEIADLRQATQLYEQNKARIYEQPAMNQSDSSSTSIQNLQEQLLEIRQWTQKQERLIQQGDEKYESLIKEMNTLRERNKLFEKEFNNSRLEIENELQHLKTSGQNTQIANQLQVINQKFTRLQTTVTLLQAQKDLEREEQPEHIKKFKEEAVIDPELQDVVDFIDFWLLRNKNTDLVELIPVPQLVAEITYENDFISLDQVNQFLKKYPQLTNHLQIAGYFYIESKLLKEEQFAGTDDVSVNDDKYDDEPRDITVEIRASLGERFVPKSNDNPLFGFGSDDEEK